MVEDIQMSVGVIPSNDGITPVQETCLRSAGLAIFPVHPMDLATCLLGSKYQLIITGSTSGIVEMMGEIPPETMAHLTPVLIASSTISVPQAIAAMHAGVWSVLALPCSDEELREHLRDGLQISQRRSQKRHKFHQLDDRFRQLDENEFQVLEMIVEGKSAKQIALDLNISSRTVDRRKQSLHEKTSSQSLADLMLSYLEWRMTHKNKLNPMNPVPPEAP